MIEEIYSQSEDEILRYFIKEEMKKNQFSPKTDLPGVAVKKTVITCVFALLTLVLISSYFFHFMKNVYLLEIVNLIVYWVFMRKFNTMRYIMKEVKSRPDEEIGYIVASLLSDVQYRPLLPKIRMAVIAVSIVLPTLLFFKPHILYEWAEDGYYVRFYTRGIADSSVIEIPEEHRGEKVVGIRGNVFANLSGIEEIYLPETINTIRGYAFAYSEDLAAVHMPENLSYLGGSAFEGCANLSEVSIPYGLTEIRGSTFKNCQYLNEIEIPEGVRRIGGEAFQGCNFMGDVYFPTTLEEIGSSAFRDCYCLEEVYLPKGVEIHEKAFIDSWPDIYFCE